jgi:hypothetical protein
MKKSSRHSYMAFDWLRTCPKIIKKVCKRKNKSAKKLNKSAKKSNKSAKKQTSLQKNVSSLQKSNDRND